MSLGRAVAKLNPRRPHYAVAYLLVDIDTLSPQGLEYTITAANEQVAERELWPGQLVVVPLVVSGNGWKALIRASIARARDRDREKAAFGRELEEGYKKDKLAGKY